jgi:hypothetical protein
VRKLTNSIMVAGAVSALLLATAPAASAGTDRWAYVYNSSGQLAGTAQFISNGDDFAVCDTLRDGLNVGLHGYYPDGTFFSRYLTTGYNTCYTYRFDFTENKSIQFRICTTEPNSNLNVDCSSWEYGVS